MTARRLDAAGLAAPHRALSDPNVVARYASKVVFGLVPGVQALDVARVLGHRCDNPLFQRVVAGHVVVSSAVENRREWVGRRLAGSPLTDPRGPRCRARTLRDVARVDPAGVAVDVRCRTGARCERFAA